MPLNRQAPVLSGGLARWATPSLWRGLRLTDPAALPRGTVSELNVEAAGAYSAEVVAELSSQTDLRLSIVAWQRGWRVGDVRPEQG